MILQTADGEWWFPTSHGIFRFPAVGKFEDLTKASVLEVLGAADGLPNEEAFRLYEDARGDVWISMIAPPINGLARWRKTSGELEIFSKNDFGIENMPAVTTFAEDANGDLWTGFYLGGIARFRQGKWQIFKEDGVFGRLLHRRSFFRPRGKNLGGDFAGRFFRGKSARRRSAISEIRRGFRRRRGNDDY